MASSIQPRKQRRALHNAPLHRRARQIRAHLSEELLVRYGKRSTTVRVGDTIKVLRGKHAGHTGEVVGVNRTRFTITVEGVTVSKADGKTKPKPIHPSDVVLTKLDLSDKLRRGKLGASDADATPAKPKGKPKAESKPEPESDPRARAAAKRAAKQETAPGDADDIEPIEDTEDQEERR